MPKISILITNHNYGKYLGRCLRSILSQDFPREDYEIVVVDDGSTDDSHIVYQIFKEDITLVALPQQVGLPKALNFGLKKCKGQYIVRVDADDFIHSLFLKVLYTTHQFTENIYDAVSCDYFRVSENGKRSKIVSAKKYPIACGVMFKSETFELLGAYKEELEFGEEVEFMDRFHANNLKLYPVNLPLYRYVDHGNSLSDFHKKSLK